MRFNFERLKKDYDAYAKRTDTDYSRVLAAYAVRYKLDDGAALAKKLNVSISKLSQIQHGEKPPFHAALELDGLKITFGG